jgi:hypothetical protein
MDVRRCGIRVAQLRRLRTRIADASPQPIRAFVLHGRIARARPALVGAIDAARSGIDELGLRVAARLASAAEKRCATLACLRAASVLVIVTAREHAGALHDRVHEIVERRAGGGLGC